MNNETKDYLLQHADGLKQTFVIKPINFNLVFKDALEEYFLDEIKKHCTEALNLNPEEQLITVAEVKELLGNDFFNVEEK